MKFIELKFERHPLGIDGVQARVTFANGYGASVIKYPYSYGAEEGLYELAVFGKDGQLTYDTPITDDVIGYLTPEEVEELLDRIEDLS